MKQSSQLRFLLAGLAALALALWLAFSGEHNSFSPAAPDAANTGAAASPRNRLPIPWEGPTGLERLEDKSEPTDPTATTQQVVIEGSILDQATSEPIPELEILVIQDGRRSSAGTTDANGRIQIRVSPATRWLELQPRDDGQLWAAWEDPIDASQWILDREGTLAISIGPTYHLEVPKVTESMSGGRGRIRDDMNPALGSEDIPLRWTAGRPWIRFGPQATRHILDKGPNWRLHLDWPSDLGGDAIVSSIKGVHPGTILVEPTQMGAIVGRVMDSRGHSYPNIQVILNGEAFGSRDRQRDVRSNGEGEYSIRAIPPGSYSLEVYLGVLKPMRVPVEVVAGQVTDQDVTFQVPDEAQDFEARIRTESGVRGPGGIVTMTPVDGYRAATDALHWSDDGSPVANFRFRNLIPGRYNLKFFLHGKVEVSGGQSQEVEVPGSVDEFLIMDLKRGVPCKITVLDADTRERVREFLARMQIGGEERSVLVKAGTLEYEDLPVSAIEAMTIQADGYQLAAYPDFEVESGMDGAYRITARLRAGWGSVVRVMDTNARPIPRVKIWGDEELLGITEESGLCHISAKERPHSMEVDAAGWTLAGEGDLTQQGGTYSSEHDEIVIVLRASGGPGDSPK